VKEGTWKWQTFGNIANYTRFNPGEPNGGTNENCLLMWTENGNWIDGACTWSTNFHLCEKPNSKPPPPPPIIESEYIQIQILHVDRYW
jgi:hypothetical protein